VLILPLYRKRLEGESWRQFFKRDWLGARLVLAYLLPLNMLLIPVYHKAKIDELPVPEKYFDDVQLQNRLQKSLPFNINWASDQDGAKIYFGKEPGRMDQVKAALANAVSKEPNTATK
jgi:hypothetical protein